MAWTDSAATYFWKGTNSDGDFRNASGDNWVNSTGTVAGVGKYPSLANADTIILPDFGAYAITTNLDNSGATGSIVAFTRQQGFAYAVGTVQNPLYLKLSGSPVFRFEDDSAGDMYIITGTTAISVLNILKSSSSDNALHLVFSHAVTTANITGGKIWFDETLFGVNSAGVATLNVAQQSGGSQPQLRLLAPVTTALNNRGGKVYWNAGTLTLLNHYDGTLTAEESVTARTLTNCNYYGGTLDLRTGVADKITVTNAIAMYGPSSGVFFDTAQTVSFT